MKSTQSLLLIVVCLQVGMVVAAQPLVIAHRGASGYLPEHTLEAKAMAHAMGADYIEQDVVLSKDNHPIVLHDVHLDTVTNVADLFPDRARDDGRYYAIDLTLDEIKQLSATERVDLKTGKAVFPQRFPLKKSSFKVPSLAEEIELIQGLNKSTGRDAGIYVEIKDPDFHRKQGKDISRIVLDTLQRYGYQSKQDRCFVQCFDIEETRRLHSELDCKLRIVQLMGGLGYAKLATAEGLMEVSKYADGVGPAIGSVVQLVDGKLQPTSFVADAHAAGLVVHPYTLRADDLPKQVASYSEMVQLLYSAANVDGAFTDFPDQTLAALKSIKQHPLD